MTAQQNALSAMYRAQADLDDARKLLKLLPQHETVTMQIWRLHAMVKNVVIELKAQARRGGQAS